MNRSPFETVEDFKISLHEIDTLLSTARQHSDNELTYATFNKSALLLLVGKFEAFIEGIAEEYIDFVNEMNLCSHYIPSMLRIEHTVQKLSGIERKSSSEKIKIFQELGLLWATEQNFDKLRINCQFSYGRHGEKALRQLFSRIALDDVFEDIKIYREEISMLSEGDTQKIEVDFRGIFNSVVNMRNNILHQNASPNLTIETVSEYRYYFEQFADNLALELGRLLSAMVLE